MLKLGKAEPMSNGWITRHEVHSGDLRIGCIDLQTAGHRSGQYAWRINFTNYPLDLAKFGTADTLQEAMAGMRAEWDRWLAFAGLMERPD